MLMGMAKPMPEPPATIAVLMPMTSPCMFTRGPPELPGLMAASVWRKSSNGPWPICRAFALMMPAVTVDWRPNGVRRGHLGGHHAHPGAVVAPADVAAAGTVGAVCVGRGVGGGRVGAWVGVPPAGRCRCGRAARGVGYRAPPEPVISGRPEIAA